MTSRCPICDGTKALFIIRPMAIYQDQPTRIYAGECKRCDANGNIHTNLDAKQLAAGEREVTI